MKAPRSKWALLAALFALLVLADQWTKYLAVERLTHAFARAQDGSFAEKLRGFYAYENLESVATAPFYVWRPVWRMNYVENPGAAWGLFRRFPPGFRHAFFTAVSIGAAFFILRYYRRVRDDQRFLQVALVFVLAGAMGNFIDRLARRYVIDFIEWYWWNSPDVRWPTFNIADSLIVVGVAMLVLHPGAPREENGAMARRRKEQAGAA
jgi:signal peptidase II